MSSFRLEMIYAVMFATDPFISSFVSDSIEVTHVVRRVIFSLLYFYVSFIHASDIIKRRERSSTACTCPVEIIHFSGIQIV